MEKSTNSISRQSFLLIVLLLLGGLIFYNLKEYVPAFLGAFTLFIVFKNLYVKLENNKRLSKSVAAFIVLLIALVIIIVPTAVFSKLISDKLINFMHNSDSYFNGLTHLNDYLKEKLQLDLLDDSIITNIKSKAADFFSSMVNSTFNLFTILSMTFFLLYFMLMEHENLEKNLYEYLPFRNEHADEIIKEIKSKVLSNAILIPLIAVLQGVTSFVGFLLFSIDEALFWGAITAFASLIPVVGTVIIWVPIALFQLFQGNYFSGIGLLLYGTFVITASDNFFRIFLQKKFADEHPLVTIFGIIIGLPLFGFIGLIFGPLLISIFLILVKIYFKEYLEKYRSYQSSKTNVF